jgi:hypothetical protein
MLTIAPQIRRAVRAKVSNISTKTININKFYINNKIILR